MNLRKWHRHLACSGLTGWKPVLLCSRRPGSWRQLTSNLWRCSLSMNLPLTPPSPPVGEKVPGGRLRRRFMVPMHEKNERRPMNGEGETPSSPKLLLLADQGPTESRPTVHGYHNAVAACITLFNPGKWRHVIAVEPGRKAER